MSERREVIFGERHFAKRLNLLGLQWICGTVYGHQALERSYISRCEVDEGEADLLPGSPDHLTLHSGQEGPVLRLESER